MPEQPADPLHYEMKIPPEKKEDKSKTEQGNRGSGEVNSQSSQSKAQDQGREDSGSTPPAE